MITTPIPYLITLIFINQNPWLFQSILITDQSGPKLPRSIQTYIHESNHSWSCDQFEPNTCMTNPNPNLVSDQGWDQDQIHDDSEFHRKISKSLFYPAEKSNDLRIHDFPFLFGGRSHQIHEQFNWSEGTSRFQIHDILSIINQINRWPLPKWHYVFLLSAIVSRHCQECCNKLYWWPLCGWAWPR